MQESLPPLDFVLIGIGHTNAHVLRMWRMRPIADVRLTCISDFAVATYSGMLPGTLSGQYDREAMEIDLVRLCAAAGAKLVLDRVTGLDPKKQQLYFAERPPLAYDALSIGVGSWPTAPEDAGRLGIPIKPMQTFLDRLDERIANVIAKSPDRKLRCVVAGAGAGGVELALGLPQRIRQQHPKAVLQLSIVDHHEQPLSGMPARIRWLASQQLARAGIEILSNRSIVRTTSEGQIAMDDGSQHEADLVIWATTARGAPWLSKLGLATDGRGFLLVRDTLQTETSEAIFAVGDTGSRSQNPLPKAGVYAVRQGPVLWENVQRFMRGQPLKKWKPQRSFLSLLNTGDGRAILTYKGLSLCAAWCWRLKDFIDRRFMAKYQDYSPSEMPTTQPKEDVEKRYCGGCGCKISSNLLRRVLAELDCGSSPNVLIGLESPDDVAVLQTEETDAMAATVDFFTAFLDDPYLLGRIAALNALSDLFAKGIRPSAALAIVSLPHGPTSKQEELLTHLLAGGLRELCAVDVPLVGGHTIEGAQTLIGFTLLGGTDPRQLVAKNKLCLGDSLVLTKPLGTGVLLAGHMRALCRHDWRAELIETMLTSNQVVSEVMRELQVNAATDVTGFGLAGHLSEMLRASGVSAEIALDAIPILPGTIDLIRLGIESTLAPGNRANEVKANDALRNNPRFATLFDPQTSGGLLLSVPPTKLSALQNRLSNAVVIGEIVEARESGSELLVRDR